MTDTIMGSGWPYSEIQALRARAEKAEQEVERLREQAASAERERPTATEWTHLRESAQKAEADAAAMRKTMERAKEFLLVASDWNCDEAEVDGVLVGTYEMIDECSTALSSSAGTALLERLRVAEQAEAGYHSAIANMYDEVRDDLRERLSRLLRACQSLHKRWHTEHERRGLYERMSEQYADLLGVKNKEIDALRVEVREAAGQEAEDGARIRALEAEVAALKAGLARALPVIHTSMEVLWHEWPGADHHRDDCPEDGKCDGCLMAAQIDAGFAEFDGISALLAAPAKTPDDHADEYFAAKDKGSRKLAAPAKEGKRCTCDPMSPSHEGSCPFVKAVPGGGKERP